MDIKTGKWPIESYAKMTNNTWEEPLPQKGSCFLLIQGSQMFVVNKEVAIESLCLLGVAGNIRCQYSNQNLGVSVTHGDQGGTKFKIRFAHTQGKTSVDNCLEAVDCLKSFVIVSEHSSHRGRKPAEQYKLVTQVVKDLINADPNLFKNSDLVLPEQNIAEVIQQCLLDPGFPALAAKVEALLENDNV